MPPIPSTILSGIGIFSDLAAIAAAHHERLDGKGYPRGLDRQGPEIETRILTVADVFDALTAERPYRAAMPDGHRLGPDGRAARHCLRQALLQRAQGSPGEIAARRGLTSAIGCELGHHLFREVGIGEYVLHVVVLVQRIDQLQQCLCFLMVDRRHRLRLPDDLHAFGIAQRLGER